MTDRSEEHSGLRGSVRRAVGGALDATVGRVGDVVGEAALDVTGATAQQIIEELEPYLIEEAVPRIVDGLIPYLTETVVPEVLAGIQEHLVEVTVPGVVEDLTPQLVEDLLPRILEDLRPYLEQELVPQVVDALLPEIEARIAPQIIEALMPRLSDEVAPQLIEALMPKIRDEVAPDLVDALMPKIRHEVVPTILDDIIEDPRVRDLIREQSQGLILDVLEAVRENLADADNIVEGLARKLLRRRVRPQQPSAVDLVLEATGGGAAAPRLTLANLDHQRAIWRSMPLPPAPPGREFAHAGIVTRAVGFAVDVTLVGWLISQGLSALVSLLDSIFDPSPTWLTVLLTGIAVTLVPIYLAVMWSWAGRSVGSFVVGTRVCTPDGRKPGFWRGLVRSWFGVLGIFVWILTGLVSVFDAKRRSLLDITLHTEVRYVVPDNQQHRYLREALLAKRQDVKPRKEMGARGSAPDPPVATEEG